MDKFRIKGDVGIEVTDVDFSKNPSISGEVPHQGNVAELTSTPEALQDANYQYRQNTAIMKEFGNVMPDIIKNIRAMNDAVVRTNQNLPALVPNVKKTTDEQKHKRIEELNRQNFLGFFNTGSNMIQGAAHGNVSGSLLSGASGVANITNNLSQAANVSEMTNLSKGLLAVGGTITAAVAIAKGGKALADAYKDAMPTIFGTGKAFGTTDDNMSMALYKEANKYNNGTNLSNEAFNSILVDLRKQGVANNLTSPYAQVAETSRIAETTAQWAYATGGDASQYAQLAGIMSRYGKSKNVADDFNYLVSAGKASGLNDTQIPEFLSGIQKVMEEGIAKGFSRSATEVADTMLMFSKLSGNSAFWQGEQGARILNQANNGLASATSLSKTSDIIAFRAISNAYSGYYTDKNGNKVSKKKTALGDLYIDDEDNYINEMMIMEQGLNKNNFGAIMSSIYDTEGSKNTKGQVERLRQMFGLNYTGARRIQELYEEYRDKGYDDTEFNNKLNNILNAPSNQNDETAYRKSVNKIAEALQTMGQPVFNLEIAAMNGIATDVSKIANFLVKPDVKNSSLSSNNPYEEVWEENGGLSTEYEINKATADEKNKKLPTWRQGLVKAQSSDNRFNPGGNGEGWLSLVDKYANYDITTNTYDSPMLEKVSPNDAPLWIKAIPGLVGQEAQKKWAEEKGYKITEPFSEDASVSDFLLEPMQNVITSLVLSNSGKVSQEALMQAIEDSPDIKKELKKDVKNGYLEDNEIQKLSKIMEKIYAELLAGINVNRSS